MPDAFAIAAAVIHADPNMSLVARYRVQGVGDGVDIRIIRSSPSTEFPAFSQNVRIAGAHLIEVLQTDAAPTRGDTFTLEDATVFTAVDAASDDERTRWHVTCRLG